MLKRQESSLSSSRRQTATTPPPSEAHHAKAIGCMSGIFQLFSKYQNPNKRLTFGKKQEKLKTSSPTKPKKSAKEGKIEKQALNTGRSSSLCEIKAHRSPTIPPEIRRSGGAAAASDQGSLKTPPSTSLVARLMGLEDLGAAAKRTPAAAEADGATAEKRRRLLQALEKCNDDLEALKKIIRAVQTADVRIKPPLAAAAARKVCSGGGNAVAEETNIPSGAAEELTRSPLRSISLVQNSSAGTTRTVSHQRKHATSKKPGEDDEPIAKLLLNKPSITESSLHMRRQAAAELPSWCSRAMVKSVEEVCSDIAWGEKREVGRIGLVLQDHLCRELIDEFVKELKSCPIDNHHHPLPLEACKRRLCF